MQLLTSSYLIMQRWPYGSNIASTFQWYLSTFFEVAIKQLWEVTKRQQAFLRLSVQEIRWRHLLRRLLRPRDQLRSRSWQRRFQIHVGKKIIIELAFWELLVISQLVLLLPLNKGGDVNLRWFVACGLLIQLSVLFFLIIIISLIYIICIFVFIPREKLP